MLLEISVYFLTKGLHAYIYLNNHFCVSVNKMMRFFLLGMVGGFSPLFFMFFLIMTQENTYPSSNLTNDASF